MKKLMLLLALQACLLFSIKAQVLNVTNNEQLNNQWCWAGCSKTVLDYYGFVHSQCDIAEYTRTTATANNYGTVNCCTNATQGCNYWNYNYGYAGSIQDILIHFGNIQNTGVANPLTLTEIAAEIQNNRLFVIRWGWTSGGGHFIVGHGISGNNIYFMNPWYGEGLHIGTYNFLLSGVDNTSSETHTWTHTNKITSNVMTSVDEINNMETTGVYPNPLISEATLHSNEILKDASLIVYTACGQEAKRINNISGQSVSFSRGDLLSGLYFIRLMQDNKVLISEKLIITDN